MRIIFLDEKTVTLGDIDFSALKACGEYTAFDNCPNDMVVKNAKDADCVITNKVNITRQVLQNLPRLKLVVVSATGYNNIDIEAAKDAGVCVCNVPGYAGFSVAQHTFAFILSLATAAHKYHRDIQAGAWQKSAFFNLLTYPTFDLAGKTIGIIGFGDIGRRVAKIAETFEMKVLIHDPLAKNSRYVSTPLDTLLSNADIVSLHCPLTNENRHLINAATLAKMKPTAFLVNTARGGLVNEKALADALNSGRIAGAAADVLSIEPPPPDNPLLKAKNMLLTPHSAWSTKEARQKLVDIMAENIKAFMNGKPRNVVN